MATVDVLPPRTIPGLHCPPTSDDLTTSQAIYNSLLHPEEQPDISEGSLKELGEIFVRHEAQNIFGIHLLHGHFLAPQGTALVGIPVQLSETARACWTKAIPVTELDSMPLHGHVFRLQPDGSFFPYEFHMGEPGFQENTVRPAFFQELAGFLQSNHLSDLLALQFLDHPGGKTSFEFEAGTQSTVMINEDDLLTVSQSRTTTGWYFKVGDDGVISCKGGDVYAPQKNNTHKVFQDSKPLPTLESLKKALQEEGIIA